MKLPEAFRGDSEPHTRFMLSLRNVEASGFITHKISQCESINSGYTTDKLWILSNIRMCVGHSASLAPCLAQGRLCLHFGVEEAIVLLYIYEYTCKHTNCPQKSLIGRQTKAEHGIWPKTTSDYVILPGLLLCRMDNVFLFSLPLAKFH